MIRCPRITKSQPGRIMAERGHGEDLERRYAPASAAAHLQTAGWKIWVPSAGGWKQQEAIQ